MFLCLRFPLRAFETAAGLVEIELVVQQLLQESPTPPELPHHWMPRLRPGNGQERPRKQQAAYEGNP